MTARTRRPVRPVRSADPLPSAPARALPPAARLDTAWKCLAIFVVGGSLVLGTVAAAAALHGAVSVFMWVRAAILLLIAPLLLRWLTRAAGGDLRSADRLRTITAVLPVAIVLVDLIPGVCPTWYAALQGATAIPLVAVAVLLRVGRPAASAPRAGGDRAATVGAAVEVDGGCDDSAKR